MTRLFLLLVQRSISAGWMILAVCLIRQFCRRIPRNTICWLWLTVAVRLILLYSPKSQVSLVPSQQTMNRAVSVSIARFSWGNYLAVVWLIGMCFMLLYTLQSLQNRRYHPLAICLAAGNIRRAGSGIELHL